VGVRREGKYKGKKQEQEGARHPHRRTPRIQRPKSRPSQAEMEA